MGTIYSLKSSPNKNKSDLPQMEDSEFVEVSLNEKTETKSWKQKEKSVTGSAELNESNALLMNVKNGILRELRKHIDLQIAPHWFFELCPVTRIGLEKVCVVIGNLNVENYLVGSFKESEMLFYTEKNDMESTIHPYKYSVIGKMWDSNVRFTKNEDFKYDLQNLIKPDNKKRSKKNQTNIQKEADYITDSIYLFDKLLPRNSIHKKDKNVQIAPLTKQSLQINHDENNKDNNGQSMYMLNQYQTMREIHENSPM